MSNMTALELLELIAELKSDRDFARKNLEDAEKVIDAQEQRLADIEAALNNGKHD